MYTFFEFDLTILRRFLESFTCRNEEKEPDVQFNDMSLIQQNNSLVIFDAQGRPVTEGVTRRAKTRGSEKDSLDYGKFTQYAMAPGWPDRQT